MAKFFHVIYKVVLLFLFSNKYYVEDLFGLISIYFKTIKINDYSIFYLHCLIWLNWILYLSTLYTKIQENKDFYMRLLVFLEYIIKYFIKNNVAILQYACFDAKKTNIVKEFISQFKENDEIVAKKVQIYFPMHNFICYKYNKNQSQICWFDFLRLIILASHINYNRLI